MIKHQIDTRTHIPRDVSGFFLRERGRKERTMAPVEQHQWQALLNQTQELVQQVGGDRVVLLR